MKPPFQCRGFTLVEILIVVGTISLLAGIVITAINPQHQLAVTQDAKRLAAARDLQSALAQYVIDEHELPAVPANLAGAEELPICRSGATNGCYDLQILVNLDYLDSIPVDIKAAEPLSGFTVKFHPGAQITVASQHLSSDGGASGNIDPCPPETNEFPAGQDGFLVPFEITNCSQLQEMAGDWNKFVLVNDIDCSATNPNDQCNAESPWTDGKGFNPITNSHIQFNGNGHTISNLYINRPSETSVGLFKIFNDVPEGCCHVNLTNVQITGAIRVGALVGMADTLDIKDVKVTGSVQGGSVVGGIAGTMEGSEGTVQGVSFIGSVTGERDWVGGILGHYTEDITVADCSVSGTITGRSKVGGIAGATSSDAELLDRCYSTATIVGLGDTATIPVAGGLIGVAEAQTVSRSFSTGPVSVLNGGFAGGLIGASDIDVTEGLYWVDALNDDAENCDPAQNITCVEEPSPSVFYGTAGTDHPIYATWDFTNVWQENSGALPTLR